MDEQKLLHKIPKITQELSRIRSQLTREGHAHTSDDVLGLGPDMSRCVERTTFGMEGGRFGGPTHALVEYRRAWERLQLTEVATTPRPLAASPSHQDGSDRRQLVDWFASVLDMVPANEQYLRGTIGIDVTRIAQGAMPPRRFDAHFVVVYVLGGSPTPAVTGELCALDGSGRATTSVVLRRGDYLVFRGRDFTCAFAPDRSGASHGDAEVVTALVHYPATVPRVPRQRRPARVGDHAVV